MRRSPTTRSATCSPTLLPPDYHQAAGLTPNGWARTREYADAANPDGAFTAIRGFEWSEPLLGHVNVWFTEHYVDVLQAGVMAPLLEWLRRKPGLVLDGGADGIAGFNHPGREPGRFEEFRFDPRVRDRMVSLEMFNRRDDYLFEGYADGRSSPLCACLDAGWRTGITGVTDEHGIDWGHPEGKGRTGLWVAEHSRAGREVRHARPPVLRDPHLRAPGRRHRLGRRAASRADGFGAADRPRRRDLHARPRARRRLGGPAAVAAGAPPRGRRAVVPLVHEFAVGDVVTVTVPLDLADGDWVLLRIADPSQPNATPGPRATPATHLGIAYTSPWWLEA